MKKHLIIILLVIVGLFLVTNGFAQEKKNRWQEISLPKQQKVSELMPLWWRKS